MSMHETGLPTENILGFEITRLHGDSCCRKIQEWLRHGEGKKVFFCANPHSLMTAYGDPLFRRALLSADLLTPDGSGIVLASRILGGAITERVTGSDIFHGLNRLLDRSREGSCFFLGTNETTLREIQRRMALDYPGLRFAGSYAPPYKPEFSVEDSRRMVAAVNAVEPDVLWVGMTAPKQEKWIYRHREELRVKFIGAIGAVFDFYAGTVKRSHPAFQRLGLEWLPRLLREPRRLWRRNLISSPKFIAMVIVQRFKASKGTT